MSLIQNEQTKLTATALNNVAVAFVVAGFVAPVSASREPLSSGRAWNPRFSAPFGF
jgi:hypothetical protein